MIRQNWRISRIFGMSNISNDTLICLQHIVSRSCHASIASVYLNIQGVPYEIQKCNMIKCMDTRPVHKNLFLEFPKMQGRFMLHFDRQTNVIKGVLLKYRSFNKFQEPPILQGRIHGTELPELGLGHKFRLGCTSNL